MISAVELASWIVVAVVAVMCAVPLLTLVAVIMSATGQIMVALLEWWGSLFDRSYSWAVSLLGRCIRAVRR